MLDAVQTSLAARTIPLAAVLPQRVRSRLAGKPAPDLRIPAFVRNRLRIAEKVRVSDWAEQHRVVTDGPHEGIWRHEHAPHTVKIMDTYGQPWVREIWFCGVEQSGKTNTMLNCLGWSMDCDPGNAFYLMPTEDTAAKITGGKIKPMINRSPRLRRLASPRQDDTTLARIQLRNGVTVFPAHANSASSMATWAAKHCFGDEVDKYPALAGREADPITLIKKRNRTYRGRYKRFFASTPAGRFIQEGLRNCHQIWEYRERCPHCQQLVRLEAECLVLPEGATPESVERDGCACACTSCGQVWSDSDRLRAIRTGAWVAVTGGAETRPKRVGFHHRAWDCLDITLAEIGAAWLRAENGGLADKIAWANGYEAIDYTHEQADRKEDYILRLVDPSLPRGVVPGDTACLLLIVDTQKRGFFYQVWACSWGPDVSTTMIEHGFVERFAHLMDLAMLDRTDAGGQVYRVWRGYIDSGGGADPNRPKHSRTTAVYEFCRRSKTMFRPVKGNSRQGALYLPRAIDYYPSLNGKKIQIPGGLVRYDLQVNIFKDELAERLQIEPGMPGGITLHAATGSEYAKQMCAEYQDDRNRWVCPSGKANHHWDCAVYLRAALAIEGVRGWRRESIQADAIDRPEPAQRRRRW